jgi:hypothetical protein
LFKGNLTMNKILLSTAAAVLVLGLSSTNSSANIQLSIGGEAKVTASMSDKCGDGPATAIDFDQWFEGNPGFDASYDDVYAVGDDPDYDDNGTPGDANDDTDGPIEPGDADYVDRADAIDVDIVALGHAAGSSIGLNTDILPAAAPHATFTDYRCTGNASEDNPVLGFSKEITFDASGTLANGLGVSFSDTLDLTKMSGAGSKEGNFSLEFSGAFGSLLFKDGSKSAIEAVMVAGEKDITVTGNDLGGHPTATAGTAGTGILYTAPSMANLDLYVGYAPNSADSGLDSAAFLDTFSIGGVFNSDMITIGAGMESATDNANTTCLAITAITADATAQSLYNMIYGGDLCGDRQLTYIGATMDVSDVTLSAGYSVLDTDEADETTMNVGLAMSYTDYDISLDYRTNKLEYQLGGVEDTQTVIGAGISTSLGDGVSLGLDFSTSNYSQASQADGNGDTSNYFAEGNITVTF